MKKEKEKSLNNTKKTVHMVSIDPVYYSKIAPLAKLESSTSTQIINDIIKEYLENNQEKILQKINAFFKNSR